LTAAAPLRAALERRAAATPEDPFLFFRGARGHFRWWSFARAAGCVAGAAGAGATQAGEAEAEAFLAAVAERARSDLAEALEARLGAAPGRDIWISHRTLALPTELALALFCARTGAAVLREPGERLHPELFAWARPTLIGDEPAPLARLFEEFAALAPRLGGARWRRRRLARLRAVVVEGAGGERVAPRLLAMGAGERLRVVDFPEAGSVGGSDERGRGG